VRTLDAKAIRILNAIIISVVVVTIAVHLFTLSWSGITLRSLLFEVGYIGYSFALVSSITSIMLARNFTTVTSRIIIVSHILIVIVMMIPCIYAMDFFAAFIRVEPLNGLFLVTSLLLFLPQILIAVLSVAVMLVAAPMAAQRRTGMP